MICYTKVWEVVVTYWPSTEPSIKRCTSVNNRCIRSKILEYHLDLWTWLNSVQMHAPTGSRWASNNYITRCHKRLESVSQFESVRVQFQLQLEIGCPWSENQLQTEGLGPQQSMVEQPSQDEEEVLLWSQEELWVDMWQSVPIPNSPFTHHQHQPFCNPFTTLLRIKCERYIFIKKCVRSFIEVIIMFLLTSAYIWVYNIVTDRSFRK